MSGFHPIDAASLTQRALAILWCLFMVLMALGIIGTALGFVLMFYWAIFKVVSTRGPLALVPSFDTTPSRILGVVMAVAAITCARHYYSMSIDEKHSRPRAVLDAIVGAFVSPFWLLVVVFFAMTVLGIPFAILECQIHPGEGFWCSP